MCLLIDGAIPLAQLFDVLNKEVDPLILSHIKSTTIPPTGWQRPFVETSTARPLDIPKSQTTTVEFMEEDESMGEVSIVFLGPAPTDYQTNIAVKILGSYLSSSATSPLQKEFVEIPRPLATSIGFYAEDRVNKNELQCSISDVPAKHLQTVGDLVKEKLKTILEKEGLDMERMGLVLRRDRRKLLNYMETSVSSVLADAIIGGEQEYIQLSDQSDFLYGEFDGRELPIAFDDLEDYDVLEKWIEKDWIALLDK